MKEDKNYGKDKKMTKSEVLEMLNSIKKEREVIRNSVWNWHSNESKTWVYSSGTEKGLHFMFEKNTWFIKCN